MAVCVHSDCLSHVALSMSICVCVVFVCLSVSSVVCVLVLRWFWPNMRYIRGVCLCGFWSLSVRSPVCISDGLCAYLCLWLFLCLVLHFDFNDWLLVEFIQRPFIFGVASSTTSVFLSLLFVYLSCYISLCSFCVCFFLSLSLCASVILTFSASCCSLTVSWRLCLFLFIFLYMYIFCFISLVLSMLNVPNTNVCLRICLNDTLWSHEHEPLSLQQVRSFSDNFCFYCRLDQPSHSQECRRKVSSCQ